MDRRERSCLYLVLISIIFAHVVEARSERIARRRVRIKDCGPEDRVIQVVDLTVKPSIIRIPGKVRIWPTLNITRDLPYSMGATVSVHKVLEGEHRKIPVLHEKYYEDICSLLNSDYELNGCPRAMRVAGVHCVCPFQKGLMQIKDKNFPLRYYLPKFDGLVEWMIEGEYEMTVKISDGVTRIELGCARLNFSVKKRSRSSSKSNSYVGLSHIR